MKNISTNWIQCIVSSITCSVIIYISGLCTNVLAQTIEEGQLLGDSIIIEHIRILRPHNYRPGDMLVPKAYLFSLENYKAKYKFMLAQRDTLGHEIDSLYRANYLLYGKLDTVQAFIDEMRAEIDYLSQKLLRADMENIRAQIELKEGLQNIKKTEKEAGGGPKKAKLLYQLHFLKKWDKVVVIGFAVGITGLVVYLIADLIITNFVNDSATLSPGQTPMIPGVATPNPTLNRGRVYGPTLRIPLNF